MPFYPDPDGESYLAYLERVEQCCPSQQPLEYERFLELQAEFDRFYTPVFAEMESAPHSITHPAAARLKVLEKSLAI